QVVDFAPRDPGDALQRAEALGLLAGLLDLGHEEANAGRERRDAREERAATAQRTEHSVERALERTEGPCGIAAEAQELLPDQLALALPRADGAPDLLECVRDARSGGERIGACLGESAAKSARVALERDDDGAHPTCHVRGS